MNLKTCVRTTDRTRKLGEIRSVSRGSAGGPRDVTWRLSRCVVNMDPTETGHKATSMTLYVIIRFATAIYKAPLNIISYLKVHFSANCFRNNLSYIRNIGRLSTIQRTQVI
jgi:hypothetical protein